jgi:hypothetical protein
MNLPNGRMFGLPASYGMGLRPLQARAIARFLAQCPDFTRLLPRPANRAME